MALTVANLGTPVNKGRDPGSPVFTDIVAITFDSAYVTGGEPADDLIKAVIGEGRTILNVKPLLPAMGSGPWAVGYDLAAGTLMVFDWAGAEVSTIDLSSIAAALFEVTSY
jgi:hypothetical protein